MHKADGLHLAPLMRHVGEAQMVGVARLRYKPNTSATQVWIGKMQEWDALAKQLDSIRLWQAGALHLPVGDSRAAGGCR